MREDILSVYICMNSVNKISAFLLKFHSVFECENKKKNEKTNFCHICSTEIFIFFNSYQPTTKVTYRPIHISFFFSFSIYFRKGSHYHRGKP